MKKYRYSIFVSLAMMVFTNAQVSIGGKSSVEGNSTLLDFDSNVLGKKATDTSTNNTNGIILPTLKMVNVPVLTSANNGTFLFDTENSIAKMYENNVWVDLTTSGDSSVVVGNTSTESADLKGVIIGSASSNANGVLVLESSNKAVILPRIIDPHINVKSPYPGMMCYDVSSKSLAVFDGVLWHYWK